MLHILSLTGYLALIILCALVILFGGLFWTFRYGHVTCNNHVCLVGKTALVTGGSSGLGYQIVLFLASRGCKIIIADKIVNDDIKKSIINTTDNRNIVLYHVDFASFKSVRELAKKLKQTEEKLDILINNCGIGKSLNEDITEDGLRMTMQINHYSPFLLTHLLTELLKKSSNGRIIFTSSIASFMHILTNICVTPTIIKDAPPTLRFFDYMNTKFLNVVTSDGFAKRLKKWNITCNAYHPFVAKTAIYQKIIEKINYKNMLEIVGANIMKLLVLIFGISPNLACQAAVELATSKKHKSVTGTFFGKFLPTWKPRGCHDKNFCENIWTASENTVQLSEEEKLNS